MTTAFFTMVPDAGWAKTIKYRCPTCKHWFARPSTFTVSCCVQHGPRECCHAFETRVHKKGWAKK
jgi:hypothetical protein